MSEIRLYIDEDSMMQSLVVALRKVGIDVITAADVARTGYIDEDQLEWATQQGRMLYSANIGDFQRIHNRLMTEERTHAGIVLIHQQRYSIRQIVRAVQKLMDTQSAEEMLNQLVYLSNYMDKS